MPVLKLLTRDSDAPNARCFGVSQRRIGERCRPDPWLFSVWTTHSPICALGAGVGAENSCWRRNPPVLISRGKDASGSTLLPPDNPPIASQLVKSQSTDTLNVLLKVFTPFHRPLGYLHQVLLLSPGSSNFVISGLVYGGYAKAMERLPLLRIFREIRYQLLFMNTVIYIVTTPV